MKLAYTNPADGWTLSQFLFLVSFALMLLAPVGVGKDWPSWAVALSQFSLLLAAMGCGAALYYEYVLEHRRKPPVCSQCGTEQEHWDTGCPEPSGGETQGQWRASPGAQLQNVPRTEQLAAAYGVRPTLPTDSQAGPLVDVSADKPQRQPIPTDWYFIEQVCATYPAGPSFGRSLEEDCRAWIDAIERTLDRG